MSTLIAIFPYALIALLMGTSLGETSLSGPATMLFLLLLSVGILGTHFLTKSLRALIVAVLVLCFVLGIWRYALFESTPLDARIARSVGTMSQMEGRIVDEPDVRETNTHVTILLTALDGEIVGDVPSRVLAIAPPYPEFNYGDTVTIEGALEYPKKFTENDGRVFDYPAYLASKGIHYQLFFPRMEVLRHDEGNPIVAGLFSTKHYFVDALARALPEPQSALLSGLLLGGKRSLGEEWLETFRETGIIHIVVLSGYNMTIVADWMMYLFRFAGFYGSLSFGAIGILLFALMTGGGATVVRAAVMAFIAILARATGRTYAISRALLLAAVIMVMENPSIILHDPSFQLSFLASLGLVWVAPVVERHTTLFLSRKILREVFVSTIATQVLVLPLLLYQTGMLSIVSLPTNMLVLPIIPFTMFFGFVAGVVILLSPFSIIGLIVAIPAYLALTYILHIAHFATLIPFAAVSLPLPFIGMAALYVLIVVMLYLENRAYSPAVSHSISSLTASE